MSEGGAITEGFAFGGGDVPASIDGEWTAGDGYVEFRGDGSGSITLENVASRVDLVMSSASGEPITVVVTEDGPPLDREWCGDDCKEDPEHGASCRVTDERAYAITSRDETELHELVITVEGPGLRVHEARFS